jgi:predicted Zn finger-like uncharacterized protein
MAARCTACSTVFRVVPDQLRVSEGWVRCGRCAEVFNAAENLIDLDSGTPYRLGADGVLGLRTPTVAVAPAQRAPLTRAQPPAPASPAAWGPAMAPSPAQAPAQPPARAPAAPPLAPPAPQPLPPAFDTSPHEQTLPFRREDAATARREPALDHEDTRPLRREDALDQPAETDAHGAALRDTPDERAAPEAPDARDAADEWATLRSSRQAAPVEHAAPVFEPTAWMGSDSQAPPAAWAADEPDAGKPPAAQPSFVRRADRAARWRQPRVRAGMAAGCAALVVLLGWQLLFSQRDVAAARWPLARAVLQPACAVLGCTLEAPRLIDSLAVESSGLLRVEKSDIYRLSVALRNRGSVDVLLPALDLSLTDPQGQLLVRRVLRAQELGAAGSTLAPGKELALQATLQANAQPATPGAALSPGAGVAGYTIELFYP